MAKYSKRLCGVTGQARNATTSFETQNGLSMDNASDNIVQLTNQYILDSLFYRLYAQILYFNTFIILLFMFRALLCSSSGGQLY